MAHAAASILKQSVLAEHESRLSDPLKKASAAAGIVNRVVQRAIDVGYDYDMRIKKHGKSDEDEGFSMPFLLAVVTLPCVWAFGGVAAVAVAGMGALALLGSLLLIRTVGFIRSNSPSVQFDKATRKLRSAIARVPDGPQKKLLREFSNEAAKAFVLGHAATLQEQIVQGGETASRIKKMYKEGIRLIDRVATKMHWTNRENLKEAFNEGRLPEVEVFGDHLREVLGSVQKAIQSKPA